MLDNYFELLRPLDVFIGLEVAYNKVTTDLHNRTNEDQLILNGSLKLKHTRDL